MTQTKNSPAEGLLPIREVLARYCITSMSLHRWLHSRNFPAPTYIGRRRYWKAADLVAWERSLPRSSKRAA